MRYIQLTSKQLNVIHLFGDDSVLSLCIGHSNSFQNIGLPFLYSEYRPTFPLCKCDGVMWYLEIEITALPFLIIAFYNIPIWPAIRGVKPPPPLKRVLPCFAEICWMSQSSRKRQTNRTRISSLTARIPLEESSNEGLTSLNIVNKKINLKWKGFSIEDKQCPDCVWQNCFWNLYYSRWQLSTVLIIMFVSRVQTRLHSGLESTLTTIRKNKISLFFTPSDYFSLSFYHIYFLLPVYLRRIFLQLI